MAYYRKLKFYDNSGQFVDQCSSSSWNGFFAEAVGKVEALVSSAITPGYMEFFADENLDPQTLVYTAAGLGGTFQALFYELLTSGAFQFPEFEVDTNPFTIIRTGSAGQKRNWQRDLWKNPANRDVFRILHRGK